MEEESRWFLYGVGAAAAWFALYHTAFFGIRKGISKYRERKRLGREYEDTFSKPPEHLSTADIKLRLAYRREFGVEPLESLSSRDIENQLHHHREVIERLKNLD